MIETAGMAGPPQGKITERLSLTGDKRQLRYEITLDFPAILFRRELREPRRRRIIWRLLRTAAFS